MTGTSAHLITFRRSQETEFGPFAYIDRVPMEKANMLWQSADLLLAKLSVKMATNLVTLRLPAVFLASIVLVWSTSCLPWVACLVTFAGKMTLAILVAAVVAVVFKKPLARLLTPLDQRQPISPRGKAVFITGCDTGFGHDLAVRLRQYGFHVFAGCLLSESEGSKELVKENIQVLQCDVTKWEEVATCADQVAQVMKDKNLSLWAVVNNAGVAVLSGWSIR
ncbi:hypothetical protein RvY_17094-2 [Ramazzottius varieornatus]|uniref:Uncharacterized protein n=1 Tax=Ramazzottius varieornatus TaxID=947166 RepID=A0A1D1W1T6_RAMVA|nr:hypothetical protein RvY_17094-2 [Ramazzottius varieornatus]